MPDAGTGAGADAGPSVSSSTRELLRSLEELRDSLSSRVQSLSAAVDRLSDQAGDLERRVGRRVTQNAGAMAGATPYGRVATGSEPDRGSLSHSALARRSVQHREAVEALERTHLRWSSQEERLRRLLEAEDPSAVHETMEQVLDANRARRAALTERLSAIRSSLPARQTPAASPEPTEYIPDWPLGRPSGDDVMDRLLGETLDTPTVTMPRSQQRGTATFTTPQVTGTSIAEISRVLGARLNNRDSAAARRSYVDALLTAQNENQRATADGDLGVSPFIASLHAYTQEEPTVDPLSALTLRGQMLQMHGRTNHAPRHTNGAEETEDVGQSTRQRLPEHGRHLVENSLSGSETEVLPARGRVEWSPNDGETMFARISRLSSARHQRPSRFPSTPAAPVSTYRSPTRSRPPVLPRAEPIEAAEDGVGLPGSRSWEAALRNWRSAYPDLALPAPAGVAAATAQVNDFEAQLELFNSGIGGLDVQAIRDIARSASRNLDPDGTPRPFSFDEPLEDDFEEQAPEGGWIQVTEPPAELAEATRQMQAIGRRVGGGPLPFAGGRGGDYQPGLAAITLSESRREAASQRLEASQQRLAELSATMPRPELADRWQGDRSFSWPASNRAMVAEPEGEQNAEAAEGGVVSVQVQTVDGRVGDGSLSLSSGQNGAEGREVNFLFPLPAVHDTSQEGSTSDPNSRPYTTLLTAVRRMGALTSELEEFAQIESQHDPVPSTAALEHARQRRVERRREREENEVLQRMTGPRPQTTQDVALGLAGSPAAASSETVFAKSVAEKRIANASCERMNYLDDSAPAFSWQSLIPHEQRRARPYISILDLQE